MADIPNWPDKNTFDLYYTANFQAILGMNSRNLGVFRKSGSYYGDDQFAGKFLKKLSMIYTDQTSAVNMKVWFATGASNSSQIPFYESVSVASIPGPATPAGLTTKKWVWEMTAPIEMPLGISTLFGSPEKFGGKMMLLNSAANNGVYTTGYNERGIPAVGSALSWVLQPQYIYMGLLYEFVDPAKRIYVMR